MSLMSHRGVHQTYHRENLNNSTCTATRIDPPQHNFVENTLPSIDAAISYGADMIEIDVKLTSDSEIILFHDAKLDCRSNGSGPTHKLTLAELKALDIGYGYTADDGATFPFRGQFFGAIPTLVETLTKFPETQFLVNLKHGKAHEGEFYANYIKDLNSERLSFVGAASPAKSVNLVHPDMIMQTRSGAKACLKGYLLSGWYGGMPEACHNSYVPIPANVRHLIWGWPHRFERRLNAVGSRSMLLGPIEGQGMTGLDDADQLNLIPKGYKGIVFTNKIEVVGPLLKPSSYSEYQ